MWKSKPTGIKILWVWTIGTAVVLFTTVLRNRMRDMEKHISETEHQHQQQQLEPQQQQESGVDDRSFGSLLFDDIIREDK